MSNPTGTPMPPNIPGNEPTVYVLEEQDAVERRSRMLAMIGSHRRSVTNADRDSASPLAYVTIYRDLAECYLQLDYAERGQRYDSNAADRNRIRNESRRGR